MPHLKGYLVLLLALPASALTGWPLDMDVLRDELVCPLVFAR